MADNYIDQDETLGYGEFAAKQITTSVVGLDPPFDDALREAAARITKATKAMAATFKAAGALPVTTFVGAAAAGHDPAAEAGALLGRLVKYVASRDNGEELVKEILGERASRRSSGAVAPSSSTRSMWPRAPSQSTRRRSRNTTNGAPTSRASGASSTSSTRRSACRARSDAR